MAATLAERGGRYGSWRTQAEIAQNIKEAMRCSPNWDDLPAYMRETLDMDANKVARMLNGDWMYADNWHDMVGYTKLAEDCLNEDLANGVEPPVVRDPAHLPKPQWLSKRFDTWQPREAAPGHWIIVMERMAKPPLLFVDEMDEMNKYKMDEDEALDKARSLNAMNFDGYTPEREYWLAKPVDQDAVKDPSFQKDPIRSFFALNHPWNPPEAEGTGNND